jgi:hypothetical protein
MPHLSSLRPRKHYELFSLVPAQTSIRGQKVRIGTGYLLIRYETPHWGYVVDKNKQIQKTLERWDGHQRFVTS